jgi:hypothetical protein
MDDYWGSLMNADEIHLYNLCSLVIDEIVESAKRVQDELRCNRQVKNVTGCTLGLQVIICLTKMVNSCNIFIKFFKDYINK